jgi:uncharacterized membrane protein YphA (DoxX/SURF4 family)
MSPAILYRFLKWIIAGVWFVNGALFKMLNLVPRHQQIVAAILGSDHARLLTLLIGFSEIVMAVWIVSGKWSRLNAITQITIVATMNLIEALLVPHLLLWRHANALFAFLFILIIYYNEFHLRKQLAL